MSETQVNPEELSPRDQEALRAAGGMGLKKVGQSKTETPAPAPEVKPEPVAKAPAPVEDIKPAPQPGTGTAPKGAAPIEVKSAFGTTKFGGTDAPVLSSFEDVQAYAKEHGFELDSPDAIRTVIDSVTTLKQKAEEAAVLANIVSNYKSQYGNLPPEVANIVDAYNSGKDYKSIIKDISAGVSFDLSRKFEEHSPISLIRQYAQPGITQEDYDELTPAMQNSLNALAKAQYTTDQGNWQRAAADQTATKKQYEEKYAQSLVNAMDNLKKQYPTMNDAAIKVVHDRMAYSLRDSLFNEDNTYKPDAAVKIAMQEFGQEAVANAYSTIGELEVKMRNQIQGQTTEQLLLRSDKPDQQGRQVADQSNVIADAVKAQTRFLKAK